MRCTHLASLLSWRAFFARVPLSGKNRPALVSGHSARRPPDAQLPAASYRVRGSRGPSHLLPSPRKQNRGALEADRQPSTLGHVQARGLGSSVSPWPSAASSVKWEGPGLAVAGADHREDCAAKPTGALQVRCVPASPDSAEPCPPHLWVSGNSNDRGIRSRSLSKTNL